MNKNIKYYMYTSIERRHIGHLAARVFQGLFMLVCIYTSVKYLPLVYTSLTSNLGPLLTAVFSYIFLKKGLSKLDLIILVVSFLGVMIMIWGSFQSDSPSPTTNPGLQPASLWIPVLAMLAVPILAASQSIVLRQLREMNEYTVGSYTCFAMVLIYGPIVLFAQEEGLSYVSNFQTLDWVIIIGLGFTSTLVQLCRTKASQYEEPAKLAVVNYFQSVFQLFFDLIFFNTMFSTYQVLGIAVVLGASSIKWGFLIKNNFLSKKSVSSGGGPSKV